MEPNEEIQTAEGVELHLGLNHRLPLTEMLALTTERASQCKQLSRALFASLPNARRTTALGHVGPVISSLIYLFYTFSKTKS